MRNDRTFVRWLKDEAEYSRRMCNLYAESDYSADDKRKYELRSMHRAHTLDEVADKWESLRRLPRLHFNVETYVQQSRRDYRPPFKVGFRINYHEWYGPWWIMPVLHIGLLTIEASITTSERPFPDG